MLKPRSLNKTADSISLIVRIEVVCFRFLMPLRAKDIAPRRTFPELTHVTVLIKRDANKVSIGDNEVITIKPKPLVLFRSTDSGLAQNLVIVRVDTRYKDVVFVRAIQVSVTHRIEGKVVKQITFSYRNSPEEANFLAD